MGGDGGVKGRLLYPAKTRVRFLSEIMAFEMMIFAIKQSPYYNNKKSFSIQ